jgi:3-phosphoshikimate 1-carboxyvinyltransferase
MQKKISPARRVRGFVRIPGDKSISHRYGMLASIAEGTTKIHNYSTGADCHSTLRCMSGLGISVEELPQNEVHIHGQGLYGLKEPAEMLDAGNSGSTIRMLSGILAAQPFVCRIAGDESLSRRPMQRIMTPLAEMGASIQARDGKYPPLEIHGGTLKAIDYTLPVPSAQVKSCVLFAGLYADGVTTVRESIRTRDHSELALREFGADVRSVKGVISISGSPKLEGRELMVPGDLSSAAFFLVATLVVPQADLILQGVGLNPTRSYLLDFLISLGAKIKVPNVQDSGGELIGDLDAKGGGIAGGVIEKAQTAALIDEIPVLAVLGALSEQGLTVRDAGELRIPGRQKFRGAVVDSFGDHRIAMACAVAALSAAGEVTIDNAEAASVSYPEFYDTLAQIVEG